MLHGTTIRVGYGTDRMGADAVAGFARLPRRAHNPLLIDADPIDKSTPIPWGNVGFPGVKIEANRNKSPTGC